MTSKVAFPSVVRWAVSLGGAASYGWAIGFGDEEWSSQVAERAHIVRKTILRRCKPAIIWGSFLTAAEPSPA